MFSAAILRVVVIITHTVGSVNQPTSSYAAFGATNQFSAGAYGGLQGHESARWKP